MKAFTSAEQFAKFLEKARKEHEKKKLKFVGLRILEKT